MEAVELILIVGVILLILWLLQLISRGKITRFSLSIKDWLSLDAEGHAGQTNTSVEAPKSDQDQEPSILDQVQRFKRVMSAHGMRPEHWSRFFKECKAPFEIQRTDQLSDETLLAWITDEKIDWLCKTFRLNRDWIDGERLSRPHDSIYFNKRPEKFYKSVELELKDLPSDFRNIEAHALFALNHNKRDAEDDQTVRLSVFIAIPLCQLSSELIVYRYILNHTSGGYPWHDFPYRDHIKIMARLSHLHFRMTIFGLYFDRDSFDAVEGGELLIPEALAKPGHHHASWHPEDYGLAHCESMVAKETERLPQVLEWMKALDLPKAQVTNRLENPSA